MNVDIPFLLPHGRGQQTISVKQTVNILGFVEHALSVAVSQPCCCNSIDIM